jgi:hypothetical protein
VTSPFSALPQPLKDAFIAQMRAEIVEHIGRELFSRVFDYMNENEVDLEHAIASVAELAAEEWNGMPMPEELKDVPVPPEVEEDLKQTMIEGAAFAARIARRSFDRMEKLVSLGRGQAPEATPAE